MANRIIDEPAFNWWAKSVLRKRNRIISKLKSKYWETTHKFGIEVPRSVEQALAIDEQTGTDHWRKALNKEMSRVKVSWKAHDGHTQEQVRKGEAKDLIGYQEIKCHLIFDIKMDFTRKARFVAGGHMTETPGSITYSSVVSRDSIRLAFLIAGLNDLDIIAGDVTNAYLFAPCREKIWFEGKMFDIKSSESKDGFTTFKGLFDNEETLLKQNLKKSWENNQTKQSQLFAQLFHVLQNIYFSNSDKDWTEATNELSTNSFSSPNILSPFLEIPTPPPLA